MSNTNKTTYALLGTLSIGPMSGYDIRRELRQNVSFFWSESDGQIYPTLAQLTKEGFVTLKAIKKNVRDKKIYSITKKGMTKLTQWLAEEATTRNIRIELLLKLFFGANVTPEMNIEHIQTDRYQTKMMLAKLQEIKTTLPIEYKDSPHLPFWLMTIDYGLMTAEAKLTWSDNVLKTLEKMKVKK